MDFILMTAQIGGSLLLVSVLGCILGVVNCAFARYPNVAASPTLDTVLGIVVALSVVVGLISLVFAGLLFIWGY